MGRLFDLEEDGYFYTRLANPTNDAVAEKICELEGGCRCDADFLWTGCKLLRSLQYLQRRPYHQRGNDLRRNLQPVYRYDEKQGIDVTLVDPDAPEEEIEKAFRPNTKMVFGETIANPALVVLDIEKFARLAHKHGVPLIVDNTFATPINCRPFEWGADIVTHSTTKIYGWPCDDCRRLYR